ncbi:MAG: polyphosphate kinase [Bacteroidia bacterium]|nr:polyphosphate kinase [Bacteroidia bacterium]
MKLEKISTRAPKGFIKERTKLKTIELAEKIGQLQNVLYAESKHKILLLLQGMDASGKDGTVKNVFRGINPLGCRVHAFKAPSTIERSHDFLWRIHPHVPPNGMIHIFNRSHYEDILVPTVHNLFSHEIIERRYDHINNFESLLKDSSTLVVKIFLHISKEEQAVRLKERKTNPEKYWKHNDGDAVERRSWDKYMKVYGEIFHRCSKPFPWHIIPADQNWYRDYLVAKIFLNELKKLKSEYPLMEVKK